MVSIVYVFRYLDYLLLLERFRDLDEFTGRTSQAGLVHVAHVPEPHYLVPPLALEEYFKRRGLLKEWCEFLRLVTVRNPQQHPVTVFAEAPYLEVSGAGDECVVEIVDCTVQGVIVHIDAA